MTKKQITVNIYCNTCKIHTNHVVLFEHLQSDTIQNNDEMESVSIMGGQSIYVLQCPVCSGITIMDKYLMEGHRVPFINYYPERQEFLYTEKQFDNFPKDLKVVYSEMISTANKKLNLACASMMRALIEGICKSMSDEQNSLKKRLDLLVNERILSSTTAEALQANRFLGNRALHCIERPSDEELKDAISILEHTITEIFEMPGKKEKLSKLISEKFKD